MANKRQKFNKYSYEIKVEVVEILQEDGPPKKIYCSTAKKSGHEYYDNYKKMDMLVIKNIKGNVRYIPVVGYWSSSLNILGIGILIFIISLFV